MAMQDQSFSSRGIKLIGCICYLKSDKTSDTAFQGIWSLTQKEYKQCSQSSRQQRGAWRQGVPSTGCGALLGRVSTATCSKARSDFLWRASYVEAPLTLKARVERGSHSRLSCWVWVYTYCWSFPFVSCWWDWKRNLTVI